MRCLLLILLALAGCRLPFANGLGYGQLLSDYEPRCHRDGDVLTIEVSNPGGLNIYLLDSVVRDGALYIGATKVSSGRPERRTLTLDVSQYRLGPLWHERVYWAECDDHPAAKLTLLLRGKPVGR